MKPRRKSRMKMGAVSLGIAVGVVAALAAVPAHAGKQTAGAPPTGASGAVRAEARAVDESHAAVAALPGDAPVVDGATLERWLHPEPYLYRSSGKRDPFAPLINEKEDPTDEPGVEEITIVGVLWGPLDRFALAQTPQGECLLLRVGDRLRDGRITAISPEGITVVQYHFGRSRRVDIPILSAEEESHER